MHPGAHAVTAPDRAAVVLEPPGTTLTYARLDDGADRLARLLYQRGLGPGDSLAVWMENDPAYFEVVWAAHRAGLYCTPVDPHLTAGEAAFILEDCGARALVTSHGLREAAAEVAERVTGIGTRLMVGDGEGTSGGGGFERYGDALAHVPAGALPDGPAGRNMLYSSGTTGRPRGVRRPLAASPPGHDGTPLVVALGRRRYGFDEDMVLLSPAPLHHAAPLWFTMGVHRVGGTVVITDRFDPLAFLALVERHRVTHALVVPTMLVRLLKLAEHERRRFDLSSLRCCIHGAAPCPPSVKERMIEWWGPVLHEYYAGTEGNGFVSCDSAEWLAHRGTVGRSLGGPVLHILGDDGEEVPTGQAGSVYFAGGPDFEYHNDPERTRTAHDPRGWTTLGDVGYLDGDGYLFLTDRRAHLIITGGVNVYPREAEDVLLSHPLVLDAAVFGIPHDELGEEVKAVVQLVDPAGRGPGLEAELLAWCRRHLAASKCPRSVDVDDELPRRPTGKLAKHRLQARYRPAAPAG